MAMGWLKGLVAPAAFPDGAQQGGPPLGGAPHDTSGLNSPMQWSTGTKTQGGPAAATAAGGSLEARCVQLQHDVDSLALFARTLLTLLEESKVVTREQFDATKQRLDLLYGKLDDR